MHAETSNKKYKMVTNVTKETIEVKCLSEGKTILHGIKDFLLVPVYQKWIDL